MKLRGREIYSTPSSGRIVTKDVGTRKDKELGPKIQSTAMKRDNKET